MEFDLKPISPAAIPEALEMAKRYRLLNEPWQAESICLDVLRIDPASQTAAVTLLLALTDQFCEESSPARAREVLASIEGQYEQAYYAGIIAERSARARIRQGHRGANVKAYQELTGAMRWYEKPRRSGRPAMTIPFCAGIPAPAL
jgi:hypothetical protein